MCGLVCVLKKEYHKRQEKLVIRTNPEIIVTKEKRTNELSSISTRKMKLRTMIRGSLES